MDRKTIKQRMTSGYNQFIQNGGKVGRKEGFKKDEEKILEDYKEVVKRLKQGCSIRNVMKLCEVSSGTAQKVKRLLVKNGSFYKLLFYSCNDLGEQKKHIGIPRKTKL